MIGEMLYDLSLHEQRQFGAHQITEWFEMIEDDLEVREVNTMLFKSEDCSENIEFNCILEERLRSLKERQVLFVKNMIAALQCYDNSTTEEDSEEEDG
jgi:hypothetical protein